MMCTCRKWIVYVVMLGIVGVLYASHVTIPIKQKPSAVASNKKTIPSLKKTRTIQVRNIIEKDMLGYRRLGKTWYPDEHSLSINGEIVESTQPKTIACPESKLMISFDYDFRPMGSSYKKGTEELRYELTHDIDEVVIAFSWHGTPRIIVTTSKAQEKNVAL